MSSIIFDTNVLLDYAGYGCSLEARRDVTALVSKLFEFGGTFFVTPTQVKDFQYILAAGLKRDIRREKGQISPDDARVIDRLVNGTLENILELGTVVAEGPGECEVARALLATHNDFGDNLIVATAMRIGADCIVTRDKKLISHCPMPCATPHDALAYLEAGIY